MTLTVWAPMIGCSDVALETRIHGHFGLVYYVYKCAVATLIPQKQERNDLQMAGGSLFSPQVGRITPPRRDDVLG